MTNYVHSLKSQEIKALQHFHRQTKEANVRSRCEMILLSSEGVSAPQIAGRVRFSGRTVRRVIERYEAEGIVGLSNQARSGRPPRATARYLSQLETLLEQWPRQLDLPFSNWTCENLVVYMAQQTDIVIGARQMENYLKAHDWRLRRPVRTIKHHQDPVQVEAKKRATDGLSTGSKQP